MLIQLFDACNQVTFIQYNGSLFVPVRRKSVHKPVPGFGVETIENGWFHFVEPLSDIFLEVTGTQILDYTCPKWLVAAPHFEVRTIAATGLEWRYNFATRAKRTFSQPFRVKCVHGVCTPIDCLTRAFNATTASSPSFWKWDPPNALHGLKGNGFGMALTLWVGHSRSPSHWADAECGPKIIVDYRQDYNVTKKSYFFPNGTLHPLACQPGSHRYFRMQRGVHGSAFIPCRCNPFQLRLNCAGL